MQLTVADLNMAVKVDVAAMVRDAIRGWGPTIRLVVLMLTATACWIGASLLTH